MSDLVEFLRARLDERAAKAHAAMHGGQGRWREEDPTMRPGLIVDERGEVVTYDEGSPTPEEVAHIQDNDPEWVLADVEAKRRIVAQCETWLSYGPVEDWEIDRADEAALVAAAESMLRLLALPDASHPDYREEWKP